jgi:hypothetical protein
VYSFVVCLWGWVGLLLDLAARGAIALYNKTINFVKTMMKNNTLTVFAILAGLGILASQAQATVITNGCAATNQFCNLSELFGGASIQVGDKLFNNFSIFRQDGTKVVNFRNVQVIGIFQDTNAPGLEFISLNNELTAPNGGDIDFVFDFKVTTLGEPIVDNELILPVNGFNTQLPGTVEILEGLFDSPSGNAFALKRVRSATDILPPNLEARVEFEPRTMLFIRKTVRVDAREGGIAELSRFQQRFSQQTPEPTSILSLLALGTLGAASTLKRKLKPSKSTKKETTKVG